MKKTTCDRCGCQCEYPNALTLLRPKGAKPGSTLYSYHFDLCDDCARKVFGFMGGSSATPHPSFTGSMIKRARSLI